MRLVLATTFVLLVVIGVIGCENPTDAGILDEYQQPLLQVVTDTTGVFPSGDTFLRKVSPNQNRGHQNRLWLRGRNGKSRVIVQWDQSAIDSAIGDGTLVSATVEMSVDTAFDWGSSGRYIGAHKLNAPWWSWVLHTTVLTTSTPGMTSPTVADQPHGIWENQYQNDPGTNSRQIQL